MDNWPYTGWARAGWSAWALSVEASTVIGLRVAKMAACGPDMGSEAYLMVSEKMLSALELQSAMLTGGLGSTPLASTNTVLRHYRRKVKANRTRLG